jgi:HSP20 family protein
MNIRAQLPSLWNRDEMAPVGFRSLRKEMDKLFDDFSRGFQLPDVLSSTENMALAPDMDVHDSEKEVSLTLELPGVAEKDIDVSTSGQMITISGEKKSEHESKTKDSWRSERSFGSFSRSLTLPFTIDGSKVEAKLASGILTVVIPKPAEAVEKVKKIAVKS